MPLCLAACGALGLVLLLYLLFEVNYFLRTILSLLVARYFKKKVNILHQTSVEGFCFLTDIDTLLTHMNNSRYLRELDFARLDFYERTGLYRAIRKMGGSVYQGSTTIRYRRFIGVFARFVVTSKILYWDENSVYMEHRFLHPKSGFVHAIALCRQRIVDCSADGAVKELLGQEGGAATLQPTQELKLWMESNAISSQSIRAKDEAC